MYNDHSTEPDKYTGWQPKQIAPKLKQFPLIFMNPAADLLSKSLTQFGSTLNYRVVYMGPRHTSNMKVFKSYCHKEQNPNISQPQAYNNNKEIQKFNFSYAHEKQKFYPIRVSQYRLFTGMNPTLKKDDLQFDSDFQCGNLDLAIYVNPAEYDLMMRVDSNTRGHTAWFYFKVCNLNPNQKIKFNLINYGKKDLLYREGMKPYVYKKSKGKWTQQGISVNYQKRRFRYQGAQQYLSHCLSFIYQFKDSQPVYFAYCIPYSYSFLLHRLKQLKNKYPHLMKISYNYQSTGGLPIPYLTITNPSSTSTSTTTSTTTSNKKQTVLCTGRLHPGQTQGSWMMDGFIQYLLSPQGHYLREKNIFEIIPMLNVDGVVLGNFRTGIMGRDLNRCFNLKGKYHQIDFIRTLAQHKKPFVFLDFHGHSAKKNVFIYGPDYKLQNRNYIRCRIFPKLISKLTEAFRYYSCLFKISNSKLTTGRAIMLRQFSVDFAYTIQASTHGYGPNKQHTQFTAKRFEIMGRDICQGFSQFNRMLRLLPQRVLNKKNKNEEQQSNKSNKNNNLKKNKSQQFLLQDINQMTQLSVLDRDLLREILNDESTIESEHMKQGQEGQENISDSDCEGEENDYSAKDIKNIMEAKFDDNTLKNTKKSKKMMKTKKRNLKQTQMHKNTQKVLNKSIEVSPSREQINILSQNKSSVQKKKNEKKQKKQKDKNKHKSYQTIDMIQNKKQKYTSFEQKTSKILQNNPSFLDGIIYKRQNKIKSSILGNLPSMHSLENNHVHMGWNPALQKIPSSNHFIFNRPDTIQPSSNLKLQSRKSLQKKKSPILSIRKSVLPMVGRSCQTLDQSNHEKSMLSEILEQHEKRKKNCRNVRIMFL